jgi:hypothetical protein
MAFDRKCFDVAEAFLSDEAEIPTAMETAILAQEIQDAIERWLILWRTDYARLREGESGKSRGASRWR